MSVIISMKGFFHDWKIMKKLGFFNFKQNKMAEIFTPRCFIK